MSHSSTHLALLFLILGIASPCALAQSYDPYASSQDSSLAPTAMASAADPAALDPPQRVGRVSLIDGSVSFHTTDQTNWDYATTNYPVVAGNSFWTEPNSRAEIREGSAAIRMDQLTEMDVTELDNSMLRLSVAQGEINLHVENMNDNTGYQVVTPHSTINILQPGTYRINSGDDTTPSEVSVLKGLVQMSNGVSTITVGRGETAALIPDQPENYTVVETQPTPFDNWSLARDNYEEPRQVTQYVSPEMTGYEELGDYGAWQSVPTYGAVWVPANVPADWAPYRYGHWVWISPWGWNWVDDAPWGFMPFHYGRWAYFNHHWGWVAGARVPHPVYAPALVAFVGGVGGGPHAHFDGNGPVGWFPLAPGEAYHPPYHASAAYVANLNAGFRKSGGGLGGAPTTQTNFANRQFATVVASKDFTSPHPATVKLPLSRIASTPVNMDAAPTPAAIHHLGGPVAEHIAQPPAAVRAEAGKTEPGHDMGAREQNHTASVIPAGPGLIPAEMTEAARPTSPHVAPGPPIQHLNPAFSKATHATEGAALPAAPSQRPEPEPMAPHPEQHSEPRPEARSDVAPAIAAHEAKVSHPQQKMPLNPTHEGWVRQAPHPEAQVPPHVDAPHPALTPHEMPHAEAPQPDNRPEGH